MSVTLELSKPEYELLPNQERLNLIKSKTERVVGKIHNGATLHLVSMLARGLREKINNCQVPTLRNAWQEALQPAYLASASYSINVALPEIRGMLDAGLAAGVCTQSEYDFIVNLASYDKPLFPDVSIKDIISHFNPELINYTEFETDFTTSNYITFKLNTPAPTNCHIVFQMQEQYEDSLSDWFHATALHSVESAREYKVAVPFNGYPRKFKWKCEYTLDCTVSA